ncbi:MAG: tRNA (guanosine(18)-2'-O)-methyltransferase TrmH [Candidatus Sumerlaeia bacterium]
MFERTPHRLDRIRQVLARRQPDLAVAVENVHDPHNVFAILRTCDAAGVLEVHGIYTIETPPDLRRQGKRSSQGARKWVNWRLHRSLQDGVAAMRARGLRLWASRLDESATCLYDLDLTGPVALIFGNEHRGVSDEAAALADGLFHIPMMGMAQSLNVSAAAAVALYEALRQRLRAGCYSSPRLGPEDSARLLDEWSKK